MTTSCSSSLKSQSSKAEFDRMNLPIAEPKPEKVTKVLPSEVPLPPQWEVKAPADAPNVVIILLDDVGYAAPSAFGGAVNMPTAEKLAKKGLRYNKFHTTALCAPTRAALKSGRNHHKVNTGSIPEIATGYAGNSTVDALSNGSWCTYRPGCFGRFADELPRHEGHLHFASGDTTEGWRGFIEGAISSGSKAAVAVAESLAS